MQMVREVLIAARALIVDKEYFAQESYAVESHGAECEVLSDDAYAFCALGALGRTLRVDPDQGTGLFTLAWQKLDAVTPVIDPDFEQIAQMNDGGDSFEVSHAKVIRAFDLAIAQCEVP